MKKLLAIFALMVGFCISAAAETQHIEGTVGKYPVVMELTYYNNGEVGGWYYYKRMGSENKILLAGRYYLDNGYRWVELFEDDSDGYSNNDYSRFDMKMSSKRQRYTTTYTYSGTFTKYRKNKATKYTIKMNGWL